jgi:hypothetical protein
MFYNAIIIGLDEDLPQSDGLHETVLTCATWPILLEKTWLAQELNGQNPPGIH